MFVDIAHTVNGFHNEFGVFRPLHAEPFALRRTYIDSAILRMFTFEQIDAAPTVRF